ncbi:MAG: hypothetical protein RL235_1023 [Chlamydiota bacterium]|jgi:16S rRNA (cytosine(967)-C(5))-methyltransferase
MSSRFRDHHIIAFFESRSAPHLPLDLRLSQYFRLHKQLGSHDRRYIGETIYQMTRWQNLLDALVTSGDIKEKIAFLQALDLSKPVADSHIAEHARYGMPPWLFQRLQEVFGNTQGKQIAWTLNQQAPTFVRVNPAKITREQLLASWQGKIDATASEVAPYCLRLKRREPLFALPEFKEGLFEIQDEASQLVAAEVQAKPKEHILDYCAGSGGKTLAFAHQMQGKGQIYLHDIRPKALQEAKKRLARAGIQHAQILGPNHPTLQTLVGVCDWVLVDVPCSGTGTLRRNPGQKWHIDAAFVDQLLCKQKAILSQASHYVKPGGTLVYATCSLLPEENEEQVNSFLPHHPFERVKEDRHMVVQDGGSDGFFVAVLRKRKNGML